MSNSIYGVSQVNEILPSLYLTSVYGATRDAIQKKGITLLINAAQELPKQELHGVESIKLFLDDVPYATIYVHFDRIADKIHEHSIRGGRILIHCVLGVSRSTSLVLAYLMKYKNMSLKMAFDHVSSRRPCVRPNPGFWRQLIEFEKRLHLSDHNAVAIPITIQNQTTNTPRSGSQGTGSSTYSSFLKPVQGSANQYSTYNDYQSNYSRPLTSSGSTSRHYANEYPTLSKSLASFNKDSYGRGGMNGYETPKQANLVFNDDSKYSPRSSNFSTTYRSSFVRY